MFKPKTSVARISQYLERAELKGKKFYKYDFPLIGNIPAGVKADNATRSVIS